MLDNGIVIGRSERTDATWLPHALLAFSMVVEIAL